MFTKLIDSNWIFIFLILMTSLFSSWGLCALIWKYLQHDIQLDADKSPPIDYLNIFMLFSIETQQTIGYGNKYLKGNCSVSAVIFIMIQSLIGIIIPLYLTATLFYKIMRLKGREGEIIFSEKATISELNNQRCFIIKVKDTNKQSTLIDSTMKAVLIEYIIKSNNNISLIEHPFTINSFGSTDGSLYLLEPISFVHIIDSESPFWSFDKEMLSKFSCEIVFTIEATLASTGTTITTCGSYKPIDIIWGALHTPMHKIENIEKQTKQMFNNITKHTMTHISTKHWTEFNNKLNELSKKSVDEKCDVYLSLKNSMKISNAKFTLNQKVLETYHNSTKNTHNSETKSNHGSVSEDN
ncbi:Inward rectifier K(+) channel Kir7.1 [Intoshia linei]|uniref:Inward rectifier K(+) channel Kir7.1 n=1 Tax=Intoshia linei TaxID=1819745 RepID=A0A177B3T4_9BILA|nr:Inward rectifier K(+) channel Kir7.1 [Intoshia linei]